MLYDAKLKYRSNFTMKLVAHEGLKPHRKQRFHYEEIPLKAVQGNNCCSILKKKKS
jgi:hypothetical protein